MQSHITQMQTTSEHRFCHDPDVASIFRHLGNIEKFEHSDFHLTDVTRSDSEMAAYALATTHGNFKEYHSTGQYYIRRSVFYDIDGTSTFSAMVTNNYTAAHQWLNANRSTTFRYIDVEMNSSGRVNCVQLSCGKDLLILHGAVSYLLLALLSGIGNGTYVVFGGNMERDNMK